MYMGARSRACVAYVREAGSSAAMHVHGPCAFMPSAVPKLTGLSWRVLPLEQLLVWA